VKRASTRQSATPVSEPVTSPTGNRSVSALARGSLTLAALVMLSGCLIDDPPPYSPPKQTPPRLVYQAAEPPLDKITVAYTPRLLTFSIPVTSEDAGEGLTAQINVGKGYGNFKAIPPATLDDPPRVIKFDYRVSSDDEAGCYQVRIRIAHASNLPDGDSAPLDSNDLAVAYWQVLLNVPPDQIDVGIEDCLNREPITQ
jgi:hypothetical protein